MTQKTQGNGKNVPRATIVAQRRESVKEELKDVCEDYRVTAPPLKAPTNLSQ
jgi:hypothetical protein